MLSIYRLPNKLPDEKILKVIRKDIFILFKSVLMILILIVLPSGLFYLLIGMNPDLLTGDISYPSLVLAGSAYYLFIWLFFFFSFINYYLDVWIITSERIINIEQRGFFSRIISEQRLYRIQDVTSETHGMLPTILRYGNVYVQTAAEKERFFFNDIPNPDNVRDMVIKLTEESRERHHEEL